MYVLVEVMQEPDKEEKLALGLGHREMTINFDRRSFSGELRMVT